MSCTSLCARLLLLAPIAVGISAAACAGTDGVTIGDGPGNLADASTTVSSAPSATPETPSLPEPPANTDVDAGPMNFDVTVPPPESLMDAGVPNAPVDAGPSDPYEAGRVECVHAINLYRASLQRAPLQRWTRAEACVDAQARYDAYVQRPHAAFRHCSEVAQNECPSWPGASPSQAIASCLQAMWKEGANGGNFRNMLSSSWSHVSCGFTRLSNGRYWLVQNYR